MTICALVPVVSFAIGCASQKPTLTGVVIKDPAQLSIGDKHEAAIKIRKALIIDLYGVKIDEVNVVKVQPDGAASGSQPIRSETNSTSSAAGSRR